MGEMKRIFTYLAASAVLFTVLSAPVQAQTAVSSTAGEVAQIDIMPGWRNGAGEHMAALRIRLAEGWKTYWRAPGDTGIPPSLDWQGSGNVAQVQFHWPVPDVFVTDGVRTIGYKHELILPMTITPRDAKAPMNLTGELQLGVCRDVCLPVQADLVAALPAIGSGPDRQIKSALRRRPDTAREAGVKHAICTMEPIKDGLRVVTEIQMPRLSADEVVVLETTDPSVWVSEVQTRREGARLIAITELVPSNSGAFVLNRADIRLTVLGGGRGVDIRGCSGS